MTKKTLFIAFVVSLGGFLFGFDANDITPEIIPASNPNKNPPRETTKAINNVFFVILFFYQNNILFKD
jgi:amino acid permease